MARIPNCVSLYGGYPTGGGPSQRDPSVFETIIDGEGIRRCVVAEDNTKLDGFILRNGMAACGYESWGNYGGGLFIDEDHSVMVNDCIFEDNSAVSTGNKRTDY
ncbi:hypothetical protein ACFL1X_07925 [Candidatus Hydrogenedentota bacterium]